MKLFEIDSLISNRLRLLAITTFGLTQKAFTFYLYLCTNPRLSYAGAHEGRLV